VVSGGGGGGDARGLIIGGFSGAFA
jgi:hypothetical protein